MTWVINSTRSSAASSRTTSNPCRPSAGALRNSVCGTTPEHLRVVYTARIADAVYVLHAFQKKTQATSQRDIDVAKTRFNELIRGMK
ncbi:type II toxin-antitoxin system RelE/ParE family toxin [Paraburkholderia sp.]|uniref:type II toxin-antitoxin system RelE/ParE family toxin n=1 Tax=Paraburkholderia sp. TaxID=1926495 RepID=UPI00341470FA